MIAKLFYDDYVPPELTAACRAMPALFATLTHTEASNDRRYELIARLSGFTAAERDASAGKKTKRGDPDSLEHAVSLLFAINPDLPFHFEQPISDAAFWTGVAFTTYLLTNGRA